MIRFPFAINEDEAFANDVNMITSQTDVLSLV